MKKKSIYTALAVVLLAIALAVFFKSLWQQTWIQMTGAVIPYSSRTLNYAEHHNVLLSVGGDRWVSMYQKEKATAYHALVIPPQVELRADGGASGNDGVSGTDTLRWLCLKEVGGNSQWAEPKSLTIVYDALTQRISVGSETYRLAKGNIFVVRLDDEWRPHVTQIGEIFDKSDERDEVVAILKRALPDDEAVTKL